MTIVTLGDHELFRSFLDAMGLKIIKKGGVGYIMDKGADGSNGLYQKSIAYVMDGRVEIHNEANDERYRSILEYLENPNHAHGATEVM